MKWCGLMVEAGNKIERPVDCCKNYKVQLEDAGFVDVVEVKYKWPQNRWPKDKKFKELGKCPVLDLGERIFGQLLITL